MRNLKLLLAYDGTRYAGWQRQKELPTIQGEVEEKLAVMTGHPVTVHGAGRTDAGVHALGMVAGFRIETEIPCVGFQKGLNSLLPDDIRVRRVSEAPPGFHPRYDAVGKAYVYRLTFGSVEIPTERLYSAHLFKVLDLESVQDSLALLLGEHDFSCFEATGSRDLGKTTGRGAVRTIFAARLHHPSDRDDCLEILISGDGFLRHMVRNIVGTLVEVGHGKRSVEEFRQVLTGRDRSAAGPTMPAKGLFLKEVFYGGQHAASSPQELLNTSGWHSPGKECEN